MTNDIIYSDGDEITVSKARAVFGNKIYVIANISSVEVRHQELPSNSGLLGCGQFGVIFVGSVFGAVVGLSLAVLVLLVGTEFSWFHFLVVGGCIFAGALIGAKLVPTTYQDQYTIVVTSTSGELRCL